MVTISKCLAFDLKKQREKSKYWSYVYKTLEDTKNFSMEYFTIKIIIILFHFQTISGLRLTDSFLKRTYEHDDIAQIFIYTPDMLAEQ